MHSPAVPFLRDVVAYRFSGDTLTLRLSRPAPDLLARLAMPFFCAVPAGTPILRRGVDTIPSAGPYYVASTVTRSVRAAAQAGGSLSPFRSNQFDTEDRMVGGDPAKLFAGGACIDSAEEDADLPGPSTEVGAQNRLLVGVGDLRGDEALAPTAK